MITVMVISTLLNGLLIYFFDTPYKRQLADDKRDTEHTQDIFTIDGGHQAPEEATAEQD